MPDLSPDARAIIDALRTTKSEVDGKLTQLLTEVADLRSGFPDGDPDSHRRYHESIIAWRELRNELVRGALTNASKVGFLAGLGWVCYAVWLVIKMEFTK